MEELRKEDLMEEEQAEERAETEEYTLEEESTVGEEGAADEEGPAEESLEDFSFESLPIKPEILRGVTELGFTEMTPIQQQAIPALLTGRDVIGQAQTGTGKTAAFGIPILQMVDPMKKEIQAIILCPTRELAMQAAEDLREFAKYMHDVKVLPVYGGQDIQRQIYGLRGTQIIVGTPGRVMDHMRRHTIKMDDVSMVILDEADEMLDMGFREDMEIILCAIEQEHQTCLFSATMPEEILNLTTKFQKEPVFIKTTQKELTVDSITQYFYGVRYEYKTQALIRLLSYYRYKRCIIFCNTKARVDELAQTLTQEGYAAEGLHGDLNQRQRDFVMGRFRSGQLTILIATDIAARGIDVEDVEAVINYDIPMEAEYYVHRIGRTGRAGKEGVSHSLCRSRDFRKIHEIEGIIHVKMEERRIPSVAEIRTAQEQEMLEKVMASLAEGHSGMLIPAIRKYCEENGIDMEAFAAAAVKMQMADIPDSNIDVDLPSKEEKSRGRHRGRSRFAGWDEDNADDGREGRRRGRFEGRRGRRDDRDEDRRRDDRDEDRRRDNRDGDRHGRRDDRDSHRDNRDEERRRYHRDEDGRRSWDERGDADRSRRNDQDMAGHDHREERDEARHSRRDDRGEDRRRERRDEERRPEPRREERPELRLKSRREERAEIRLKSRREERFEGKRDKKEHVENANSMKDKSYPQKSDHRKQKEQSRKILKQAMKDVSRHGKDRKRK